MSDNRIDAGGRTWLRCADCREPFFVSLAAAAAFAAKSFPLPRRCFECRQKRRLEQEIAGYEQEG